MIYLFTFLVTDNVSFTKIKPSNKYPFYRSEKIIQKKNTVTGTFFESKTLIESNVIKKQNSKK